MLPAPQHRRQQPSTLPSRCEPTPLPPQHRHSSRFLRSSSSISVGGGQRHRIMLREPSGAAQSQVCLTSKRLPRETTPTGTSPVETLLIDGGTKRSVTAPVPPAVPFKQRKRLSDNRRRRGAARTSGTTPNKKHASRHPSEEASSRVPRALRRLSFKFVGGTVRTVGGASVSSAVLETRGVPSVCRVAISVGASALDLQGFYPAAPVKQSSVQPVKQSSTPPLKSSRQPRPTLKGKRKKQRNTVASAAATDTGKQLPSWKASTTIKKSAAAATTTPRRRSALPFKIGAKLGAGTAGLVAVATLRRPVILPSVPELERLPSAPEKTSASRTPLVLPVGLELAVKFFVRPAHGEVRYAPSLYCEGWREMCIHSALTGHPRILPLLGTFVGNELLEPSYELMARGRSDLSHALENGDVAGVTLRLLCADEQLPDASPFSSSSSSESSP